MIKDQKPCARRASTIRSGGTFYVPPHLPGTGGVEGSWHKFPFMSISLWNTLRAVLARRSHGMDAAASKAVTGTEGAGNAKGVLYDN